MALSPLLDVSPRAHPCKLSKFLSDPLTPADELWRQVHQLHALGIFYHLAPECFPNLFCCFPCNPHEMQWKPYWNLYGWREKGHSSLLGVLGQGLIELNLFTFTLSTHGGGTVALCCTSVGWIGFGQSTSFNTWTWSLFVPNQTILNPRTASWAPGQNQAIFFLMCPRTLPFRNPKSLSGVPICKNNGRGGCENGTHPSGW